MVIDYLNHLEMYVLRGDLRNDAYRILMYIKTRWISPLVVWEAQQEGDSSHSVTQTGMSFLIDCLVPLNLVELDSSLKKALAMMKLRDGDHDKRLRQCERTAHGLVLVAHVPVWEGIIAARTH